MGLIYGNTFLKENVASNIFDKADSLCSVAFDEYCNYLGLLESCTDENERTVLEAKTEVLKEVAIKDIIEKIKELWRKFKEKVKEIWNKFFHNEKREEQRSKDLLRKAKEKLDKTKHEASLLEDADSSFSLEIPGYEYTLDSTTMELGSLNLDRSIMRYMNDSINIIDGAMKFYGAFGSANYNDTTIKANLVDQNVKEKLAEVEASISKNIESIKIPELKIKESKKFETNKEFLEAIEKSISLVERDIGSINIYHKKDIERFISACESNVQNLKAENGDPVVFEYYNRANNIAIRTAKEYLQILNKFYIQLISLHEKYNNKLEKFVAYLDSQLL